MPVSFSALHTDQPELPREGARFVSTYSDEKPIGEEDENVVENSAAYRMLNRAIKTELRSGRPTYALKLLSSDPMARNIKNAEYDQLRATIARSYLTEGMTKRAFDVAKMSSARSRHEAPTAAWVGGLSAWKLKDYSQAAELFVVAAESSKSSSWMKSAAGFWASRAFDKLQDHALADQYLELASQYPRTFYGLIALRSLDRNYAFNWKAPVLEGKHRKKLDASAEVQESIRLSQRGSTNTAMTRLGKAGWLDQGIKQRQLLAYVLEKDAPALSLLLGRKTRTDRGDYYDVALYPETPWGPEKGYDVDPAIVNALIRQESRFNPQAKNASGASGLMQLMPKTASYMAKGIDVSLTHPQTNIAVGQKYVQHLLMDRSVNNDLFSMAIAYNAGPGNLARWKRQFKDIEDPLLFIESIPVAETRAFVERVMLNYWMYRIRMGKDNPSLDAVASRDEDEYVDAGTRHTYEQLAQR